MGYDVEEDGEPFGGRPRTRPSGTGNASPARSPYSPPVRLVADEITSTYFVNDLCDTPMVTLARIEVHSQDIATSTFESLTPSTSLPDKRSVGALPYQHMAPEIESPTTGDPRGQYLD